MIRYTLIVGLVTLLCLMMLARTLEAEPEPENWCEPPEFSGSFHESVCDLRII